MTPSRVAIISYHTSPLDPPGVGDSGGMNVYVRETATAMAAAGMDVDIFTRSPEAGPKTIEMSRRLRLVALPAGRTGADKESLHDSVEGFVEQAIEFAAAGGHNYQGILSHYWLSGLAANQLSRTWSAPHVASFHTVALAKQQSYAPESASAVRVDGERQVAAASHRIIAASEHERDVLVELCGADPRKVAIVPPAVDHARFRPLDASDCRRRLKLAVDRRYLLIVGRTAPLKGIEVLLEALSLMADSEPMSLLVVGGERGSARLLRLEAAAEGLGLSAAIQFVGSVSHDELPLYYGAADICVVPSYYESYGMVALEAQACGRPVIASAVGGLASVVSEGVTGLLVPPGSPVDLCRAVQRLLLDSSLAKRLGAGGVEAARSHTWRATTEGIVAALSSCERPCETAAPVVP